MTTFPEIDLSALNANVGDKKAAQKIEPNRAELPAEPDWSKVRKANPLNRLLDATVRWAEDLPPEVKPQALMAKYPRLANMAATSWKQPSAFRDYLDVLLVDRRGGRKGFSPDILAEFEQLRTYYFYGWYRSRTGASIYRDGPPDALRIE
jgi:hypothetical protein